MRQKWFLHFAHILPHELYRITDFLVCYLYVCPNVYTVFSYIPLKIGQLQAFSIVQHIEKVVIKNISCNLVKF